MNHLREGHDATVVVRNGVNIILADGGGISLLTKKGMAESTIKGHYYLIEAGTP